MKYLHPILLTILLQTTFCQAAKPVLHWAAVGQAAFKFQLFPAGGANAYASWGRPGIGLATLIEGADEMSLDFTGRIGVFEDISQYSIYRGGTFGIENLSVVIHPEILFPTRFPRLMISAGFALDWKVGSNMFVSNTEDNTSAVQFDFDQIDSIVSRHERKVMPLLSCGVVYKVRDRIWIQAFIEQAMLNTLPGDPAITFVNNNVAKDIKLHHQPTYLGIGFWYYFN